MRRKCAAGSVLLGCWLLVVSAEAVVQVLPDAALTVQGRTLEGHDAVMAHSTVKEILSAFGRAEAAVNHQDLDALMTFYARGFNYHGLQLTDVRRIWSEAFEHYRDVSSTHLFSDMTLMREGREVRATITCTGGLYGTERTSGKSVTLDSWFREVHHLIQEDGAWRFLGNAGDAPTVAPFASAPHHPLF